MPSADFTSTSGAAVSDPVEFTFDGVRIGCHPTPPFDAFVVTAAFDAERPTLAVAAMLTFVALVVADDSRDDWEAIASAGVDPAALADVCVWLSQTYAAMAPPAPPAPPTGPVRETRSTVDDVRKLIASTGTGEIL
jgi:hypothetical protein